MSWFSKLIFTLFLSFNFAFAVATYTVSPFNVITAAQELASQIQGEGLVISNPVLRRGSASQTGLFENGITGANLEIDEGIILTAMSVEEAFTGNSSDNTSINNPDITPDADLLAIDNRARYDTVVFEFDVTLEENTRLLLIEYQFASDEYNEYVGSQFNDTFGFFLSGGDLSQTYNIARVVDSSTRMTTENIQSYPAVTVNNVNNGSVGIYDDGTPQDLSNSAYFIDNTGNSVTVEFDGLTHKLQAAVDNLTPGVTYHFKMALADTGDSQWDTGVFVKKIVGVKEPQFCYDYSYSQNGKYFTEFNDGTKMPYIEGGILPNDDINVSIYIRNEESSDVLAKNMTMDVFDINATQAIYKRNSTFIVNTGEVVPEFIPDSSLSVSDENITNIPYDNLDSQSYAYLYYGLVPQGVNDINMSLNAQIHYDVDFYIGGDPSFATSYINQHYDPYIGTDIPMCSGDNTKYEVDWGIFNVVAKGIYTGDSNPKYNIPTQVVRQPQEMYVLAHDETGNNLYNEINSTILVGVDLINAGKFHSVKASCDEPTSAMSPIVWMAFDDSPYIDLRQEIAKAISDDRIVMSSVNDYYPEALQNAAYRISFIRTNDVNEDLVDTSPGTGGPDYLKLNNFTELVQDISVCKQPVRKNEKFPLTPQNSTMQVPVACANAGNTGLSPFEYQRCMECLFGYNTSHICSRDNFAIRPESFNVKINDVNQTNPIQKERIADDRTGVTSPNTQKVNIAAGYNYELDINATSHTSNTAVPGYTRIFSNSFANDYNASFVWAPTTPTNPATTCNNTNPRILEFNMVNGSVTAEANTTNVGEYHLNIVDKSWTAVDWDITKMSHHGGANGIYFVQGSDCIEDSSFVTSTGSTPSINGGQIINSNGCLITTNNHNNQDTGIKYRDYNITSHPYEFALNGLVFSRRADANLDLNNTFIYMSDVDDNNSMPMALNIIGNLIPRGYSENHTGITLSNFVTGCYAKDVNLTLDKQLLNPLGVANILQDSYKARFIDRNSTNEVISDFTVDVNASDFLFTLAEGNFTKDNLGVLPMEMHINIDKEDNVLQDPVQIRLENFDVNCSTSSDCKFNADLVTDKKTEGTRDLNNSILNHYYGRVHAPDQRFEVNPGDARIYYEVYCEDCTQVERGNFLIGDIESPDSINWYRNLLHDSAFDGNVTDANMTSVGNSVNVDAAGSTPIQDGMRLTPLQSDKVPNKERMQMRPDPWLLYNRFNANPATNDFNVEFYAPGGNWAGDGDLGHTVDENVSTIQNRRLDW